MDHTSGRALVADAARQRQVSTLLVCFCALRDPSSRSEAAKALASFKRPRVIRCFCTVLAVMAQWAPAGGADEWLNRIEVENAVIASLSALTGIELQLVERPPQKMPNDEDDKQFAARLDAARRTGADRCIDAAKHGEHWLEKNHASE